MLLLYSLFSVVLACRTVWESVWHCTVCTSTWNNFLSGNVNYHMSHAWDTWDRDKIEVKNIQHEYDITEIISVSRRNLGTGLRSEIIDL